ncbi:MAG: molybdopterin molybdotransferase MoeA [Gammaproteobacteria bacterium]|nr:molybdopterin molybdotransferase MoeA [Gammaproteobacteria bacterium]
MSEPSPLTEAQQKFSDAIPFRRLGSESCALEQSLGRVTARDITAPEDMPAYNRAIVEGFLIHTEDGAGASEEKPASFRIVGAVKPGDRQCPTFKRGQAVRIATGSLVPDGPYSSVRAWEAKEDGESFTISRPFPPRFFIEEKGCDLKQGATALPAGTQIDAAAIGTIAALGIPRIDVSARAKVTVFASGDEVIPYTEALTPGAIRDSNTLMLAAAVTAAGASPLTGGIMNDDFDAFVAAVRKALEGSDMILISGGTAVGGRDFISDLVKAVGELLVDGVPMRSGRPLIMGHAKGKPIVCVAGHPPEALRGFRLFGVAALNRLAGCNAELPKDE